MAKKIIVVIPVFLIILAGIFLIKNFFFKKTISLDPLVSQYTPPGAVQNKGGFAVSQTKILTGGKSVNVPILMYHYIEYNKDPSDTIRAGLTVTPYWFEKQLIQISDAGYQTIGLDELFTTKIKRPIILTFDDGYRDFYTDAYPLLKKYHMKATIYIISDFLNRPNYMDAWMLKQIATDSAGLITIGAHTLNHPALPSLTASRAYDEIAGSKDKIEQIIGKKVVDFCYPYGAFNQANIDMVKSSGYLTATTTLPGTVHSPDNIFTLHRIRIGNYDGEKFLKRLLDK